MAITIINLETETAIRRLATLTGKDPSTAVRGAVEAALAKVGKNRFWEARMGTVRAKLASAEADPHERARTANKPFYDALWDQ